MTEDNKWTLVFKKLDELDERLEKSEKTIEGLITISDTLTQSLESRCKRLQETIDEIDNKLLKIVSLFTTLSSFSDEQVDAVSKWRFLVSMSWGANKETTLKSIETLLESEKRMIDETNEEIPEISSNLADDGRRMLNSIIIQKISDRICSMMPLLVAGYKITFDEITGMFFGIFGKETARKLIPQDVIMKMFGTENAQRWNEL